MVEPFPDSISLEAETSGDEDVSEDIRPSYAPEVLRCTRSGTVIGRSNLEEACGQAHDAQKRQQLLHALQRMNLEEKLRCSRRFKEKGNAYYAADEYLEAISCYEQGLMALDFGSSQKQETVVTKQLLLPLLLNLAACLLKLRRYAKARAVCDIALRVDPQSLKGLYRRGVAEKELGNLNAAKLDFRRLLALCEDQRQPEHHEQQQQEQEGRDGKHGHQQPRVGPTVSGGVDLSHFQKADAAAESPAAYTDAPGTLVATAGVSTVSCSPDQTTSLVKLCRLQLASVHRQERQYNAMCLRMFKPRISQEHQESRQQNEAATVEKCKKPLMGSPMNALRCWIRTCVCQRRDRSQFVR